MFDNKSELKDPKNFYNWFNEQFERNVQSNVEEVLQDIKNHITPLETKDVWIEIKSTL